eukprot:1123757-Prymnesium_polylepis.1
MFAGRATKRSQLALGAPTGSKGSHAGVQPHATGARRECQARHQGQSETGAASHSHVGFGHRNPEAPGRMWPPSAAT